MRKMTVWPPAVENLTERGNCCRIDEWRISTTQSVSANWQSSSIAGGRGGGSSWSRRDRRVRNRIKPRQRASDASGAGRPHRPDGRFQWRGICSTPDCFSAAGADRASLAAMTLLCISLRAQGIGLFLLRKSQGRRRKLDLPKEDVFARIISASQCQRWCSAPAYVVCGASRTVLSARRPVSFRLS